MTAIIIRVERVVSDEADANAHKERVLVSTLGDIAVGSAESCRESVR